MPQTVDIVRVRIRQERSWSINPWQAHNLFIISQALVRDEVCAVLSRGTKYAIDSKLTRVIRDIAPGFNHKLFLSATPHNGHSNSFSALREIHVEQEDLNAEAVQLAATNKKNFEELGI